MIKPTIGRVVWFTPRAAERNYDNQPWPAFITYVHGDRMINVAGFNSSGTPFAQTSVDLMQGDEKPSSPHGFYASWMPYQVTQAAKNDTPPAVTPIASTVYGLPLIQTAYMKKNLADTWITVNLQLAGSDTILPDYERAIILRNTYCGPNGELDGFPAFDGAGGFERADTVEEQARLDRVNASPKVYDVTLINGTWQLDLGRPLVTTANLRPVNRPLIYAIRARTWADVDAWAAREAADRGLV